MTDEGALLERARAYDDEALGELYDRYAPKMYAYMYRRLGHAATAEDLTGELFLRVLRSLRNDQAWCQSFSAWLYRIAHNLVVDHYRSLPELPHQTIEPSMQGESGDLATALEGQVARERVRAATRRLTPDQQEVLALRYGEGLTSAETAQILDKSTGAVEALQHRALASLRRILEGEAS